MYKLYTREKLIGIYETLEQAKDKARTMFNKSMDSWGGIIHKVYIERMTDFSIYTDINDEEIEELLSKAFKPTPFIQALANNDHETLDKLINDNYSDRYKIILSNSMCVADCHDEELVLLCTTHWKDEPFQIWHKGKVLFTNALDSLGAHYGLKRYMLVDHRHLSGKNKYIES